MYKYVFCFPKYYVHYAGNILMMFYFEYCEKKSICKVLHFAYFHEQMNREFKVRCEKRVTEDGGRENSRNGGRADVF